jgi:predicted O-linked N-acetylglucosamine transferase (SPINDLY family)
VNGDDPAALYLLGVTAYRTGDIDAALSLIEQAIRCEPTAAHQHHARGAILQRQGRVEEALAAYEDAIHLQPDYVEAHLNRGVVLQQQARLGEALQAFDRALSITPGYAGAHFNRGVILERQGQLEQAIAAYDQVLRIKPDCLEAYINRGAALMAHGRTEQALESFDRALRIGPAVAEVHFNRGNALKELGLFAEALAAYDQALRIKPGLAQAHFNRGIILERERRLEQAIGAYDEALRVKPDYAEALLGRAKVLHQQGRLGEALEACGQALEIRPELAAAHLRLGLILAEQWRLEDARAAFDQAIQIDPNHALAHNNRGNVLKDMGLFQDAAAAYERALRIQPDLAEAHSNYLYCLNYDPSQDDVALFAAHCRWADCHGHPNRTYDTHAQSLDPQRRLRVGLVSADFLRHPVGYLVEPLLAAAHPDSVPIVCYSGRRTEDDLTERLKAKATSWRSTLDMTDAMLAEAIRADGINVLIDLAGHTAGNRLTLFALKPAPVQVSWIGYPYTTGLRAIDYVLMDEATVPSGEERWFVERVVRLPETRFCYAPPEYAPPPEPPPVLERGHVTFGSFNNLAKVTPEVLRLWARLLQALPEARLLLKWHTLGEPGTQARYRRLIEALGVDSARVELRAGSPHRTMLAEYGDIDIALDPFPYSGGITSLEALWQGVPIVTLPGSRPVSRQTLGFLRSLGRAEWVARDPDEYVRISVGLASDPRALAAIRRAQRARVAASPLCDAPRFARHFEAALRVLWRNWCDAQPAFTRQRERQDVQGAGQ